MVLAEASKAPLFLWAVPEDHTGGRLRLNSFCGINLGGHALTRNGYRYDYVFAVPDDPAVIEKIDPLARAGRARQQLAQARLGRVGENPDGFETCLLDPVRIKERFGVDVYQFDLEKDIFSQVKNIETEKVDQVYARLDGQVEGLGDLDPVSTRKSLGVYATLKDIAAQKELGGFAVRCWPEFFTELGCAACGAMSLLSDEKTPCSCEADVNGTITQMILQSISGEPAFGTDMVSLDAKRDALVVWHCGLAPLSMADPEQPRGVTIHSNRKLPLLFEFTLKPGRVTIARLTESSGEYRLVVGSGQVLRAPKSFSGTSGLIQFDSPAPEVLDVIIGEGLEHHISLTYGDHVPALLVFADLLDLPVLYLNELP
jgi:L-fucose isomerase-like protein